ncbi:GAF sensor signal transduction histidine kinase [Ignavibacterium album JCM 16511]|uniref:GAF sensor signal transduction histidine kinase n=1 Tax=Ignavibacterium album (strain DSM 19864 / JCM 16511 / NBRC 101810 / Mat9-16) TaxID=945713 RepID=I0AGT7_IGNAJ|nr:cyclic nucleotide-binding domain-containing protein [Ignavibacterium album]AFH48194.1 GAF sensor signal transduction histidine kinase [Ignavibacterium album JCM 16511]
MIATKNNDSIFLNILFNGIKNNSLPVNLNGKLYEDFKEGEIIYESGEESNFIYLIISGKVKIKENGVKKLQFRRENEFFGEKEIIKNSNRTSSAMAESDSTVYKISKQDFENILKNVPAIKQNIIDFTNLTEEDFVSHNQITKQPLQVEGTETLSAESENIFQPQDEQNNGNGKEKIELPDYLKELDEFEEITHDNETKVEEVKSEEENDFLEINSTDDFELTEPNKDETFLDTDFEYENNPEVELSEEVIDEINRDVNEDQERLIPVEEEIETILEEKVSLKNFNLILNQISANQNLSLTVQSILKNFLLLTGSDRGIIFLFDEKKSELIPEYNIGGKSEIPNVKLPEGITGKAASSKKIIFIQNPESDARYVGSFDNPFEFAAANVIYLPLFDNQIELQGFATLSYNEETISENFIRQLKIYSILAGESILLSKQLSLIESKKHLGVIGDVSKFLLGDIKSPMLTIKHYTSIISRFDIPDEIKRVITLLTMQANSVLDLLQSTSDFAEKKSNIRKTSVQLNDLLNNILDLLSEFVESKNIKLYKKFAQNCTVNIDPRKFHVAIYELIKYASSELPSGGKIFFSTEFLGKEVQIRIYNEGKFQQPERFPLVSRGDLSLDIADFFLKAMNANFNVAEKNSGGVIFIISIPVTSN